MAQRTYNFLLKCIQKTSPELKVTWKVPFDGEPCILVGNHVGAFGPIDMVTRFEKRDQCLYWMNADMLDRKLLPAYVRQDYWWKPGCLLEPLYNITLPYIAAAILPPIMKHAPTIPVYHDMRVMTTLRQTMRALQAGKYVGIFPEQPSGWKSHHTWINTGFFQVAPMYYKLTGKAMKFWPFHLDHSQGTVTFGEPVVFDPTRTLEEQTQEMSDALAKGLRGE